MNLQALDISLRAASAAWLLLAALLLWRGHGRLLAGRLGALFALGVAAYALQGAAEAGAPRWWQAPLIALSAGNGLVFWLFSRALFDDAFRFRRRHVAAWLAFAATGLLNCYLFLPFAMPLWWLATRVLEVAPLLFSLLAVVQTFATWPDDLVERRRKLRAPLVAVVAAYSGVVAIAKLALPIGARPELGPVIEAAALAIVVALVMGRLVVLQGSDLFGAPEPVVPPTGSLPTALAPQEAAPQPPQLAAEDQPLVARLQRLMSEERAYRQENLTIGALAEQMGLPEHRLRRLINQGLGHRNFNAFLNGYRLADAKRALADPSQAEVPVLTIAMDAGFQSLGPFNRAFKADTGQTPTEFRREHLGPPGATLADSKNG
jgi:AraC-like DNA-binding protein